MLSSYDVDDKKPTNSDIQNVITFLQIHKPNSYERNDA